ncbi:CPBP family intramembrane glutamic endopeptidase [Leeuwenhoekiella sp. NPDC079379]|uniref:CPBP family intramembrane glutamic endopeptidase n=1 Tax=Leeuwenhoekiella sp. NPDC079379 TaxID=3364122 RepID=UPI0037C8BA0C
MGLGSRIEDINSFIKSPDDCVFQVSIWEKIKYLITAVSYDFGIAFIFVILSGVLSPLLEPYENLLNTETYTIWTSILIICILTPLLEEGIFRFSLKYKRNYLLRVLGYLLKKDFSNFWKRNLRPIVYIVSAVFGFIHLSNYTNVDLTFFLLAPIIVGAQLFAGIIFSFLRLKLGFLWAVLGHFFHNFILIMLAFLFFHNVERELINNENVIFKATGIAFTVERASNMSFDTLNNGNLLCLEVQNYSLQKVVDKLYPSDSLKIRDNDQVDFNLISKTPEGYAKEEFLKVLKEHYTFKKSKDSTLTR